MYRMPCVFGSRTTLQNMTHFFKSVRGYDSPRQRHLITMLLHLSAARSALIFLGDSTLGVSGVACAIDARPFVHF